MADANLTEDQELTLALLDLTYTADAVTAGFLNLPVEELTPEVKENLSALESAGHRCLNPFWCERLPQDCYTLEVYGF